MEQEIIKSAKERMEKAISSYSRGLANIRAGRASAAILDRIQVEYYGAMTPLNQVAGISVPEARMLVIQPYDPALLSDIEKAILRSDLGLNPSNDGTIIRLVIPPLTEERRLELVKQVKREAEDAKVAIRNIRRDANDDLKKLEKAGDVSEDAIKGFTNDVQKLTDEHIAKVDQVARDKEKELIVI